MDRPVHLAIAFWEVLDETLALEPARQVGRRDASCDIVERKASFRIRELVAGENEGAEGG